jgi:hypothetical protein
MAEDERSIANRLANEEKKSDFDAGRTSTKGPKTKEQKLGEEDPTAPVRSILTCLEEDFIHIYCQSLHRASLASVRFYRFPREHNLLSILPSTSFAKVYPLRHHQLPEIQRIVAANAILFQAKLHGNEPSRGAQVDKEIAEEEAEMIAKKDAKKK